MFFIVRAISLGEQLPIVESNFLITFLIKMNSVAIFKNYKTC